MTIKLSKAGEQYIQKKVATGEYESASDVAAHALTVLKRVEKLLPSAQDDLLCAIDAGLRDVEEGRVVDWDPEALKRELIAKSRKAS